MISIICACNNDEIYQKMLVKSLDVQTYRDYELIKLDAKVLGLSSAASVLNYGASLAKGDLLLFVHQDVEFLKENFLQTLVDYADKLEFGIAGVAGAIAGEKIFFSSVINGLDYKQAGIKNVSVKEVDALDECLLLIKRDKFQGFKEYNSWHFYGVEYSLRCKRSKEKVLILPLEVYHLSPGWSLNENYWDTLKKVAKDYNEFKVIPTTVGQFRNGRLLWFSIFFTKMKIKIKSLLISEKKS